MASGLKVEATTGIKTFDAGAAPGTGIRTAFRIEFRIVNNTANELFIYDAFAMIVERSGGAPDGEELMMRAPLGGDCTHKNLKAGQELNCIAQTEPRQDIITPRAHFHAFNIKVESTLPGEAIFVAPLGRQPPCELVEQASGD